MSQSSSEYKLGSLLQRNTRKSRRDAETEALNTFFTSVFTAKSAFRHPGALREPENPKQGRLTLAGGRSGQGAFKQIGYGQGSDGMDPQELRKLALVVARSLLVFFESSWQWGTVPEDWKNVSLLPSKGQDRGSGEPPAAQHELDQRVTCKKELLDSEGGYAHCLSHTRDAERGCETLKTQLDNTLNLL